MKIGYSKRLIKIKSDVFMHQVLANYNQKKIPWEKKKPNMFSKYPGTGAEETIVKTNFIYISISQLKPCNQNYVLLFNIYISLHNSRFN